jgi:hypothetical protein
VSRAALYGFHVGEDFLDLFEPLKEITLALQQLFFSEVDASIRQRGKIK